MRTAFTENQISDIKVLVDLAEVAKIEIVLIGATALLLQFENLARYTKDIDIALALDLEDFEHFTRQLRDAAWQRDLKIKHRWRGSSATIVDLLPAGPKLRMEGRITWPASGFSMRLAGFQYVFREAISIGITPDVSIRAAPPHVLALLKILAHRENPHMRAKDLNDIQIILSRYAEKSGRLFSDEVFDAQLPDFGLANAFLFGRDLQALGAKQEAAIVEAFLDDFGGANSDDREPTIFAQQCAAAITGWNSRL